MPTRNAKKRLQLFIFIFLATFCVALIIIFWLKKPHLATPNAYITLTQSYLELKNTPNTHTQSSAQEDARALIQRANATGYQLIDSHALAQDLDSFVIIATLPRGIYNLGLIPSAKHFAFAKSPSLKEIGKGTQEEWNQDSPNRSQQEFLEFLGADKNAKILFYDEGDDIFAPVGSAHAAILWAQNCGYTNLYRLVGGFGAWKALGNPISTQKPHCCE